MPALDQIQKLPINRPRGQRSLDMLFAHPSFLRGAERVRAEDAEIEGRNAILTARGGDLEGALGHLMHAERSQRWADHYQRKLTFAGARLIAVDMIRGRTAAVA